MATVTKLADKLFALPTPVLWEVARKKDGFPAPLTRTVNQGAWRGPIDWKGSTYVSFMSMNALNTEDEQGQLTWKPPVFIEKPICFDLGEVPPSRVLAYLGYIFKAPK